MSTNDHTDASSRRQFIRATATGATAAGLGIGATSTAAAQESDGEGTGDDGDGQEGTPGNESSGEGHSEEEGEIVLTPSLQAIGAALVLGVLSPILFALALAFRRGKVGKPYDTEDEDELKRIDAED